MTSQPAQPTGLPPLSTPELDSLASRLEQGLLRLTQLTTGKDCEQTAAAVPETTVPADDVWANARKMASSERRAFPRRDGNGRVAVCRLEKDDWPLTPHQIEWRLHATTLKGSLSDLSLQGAGFLLPQAIPVGEAVVVRLFCPRRDHHLDQHATVLGLVPEGDEWKLMCQFRNNLSLEQISVFSRFLNDADWV
jgi:hypothetical protein